MAFMNQEKKKQLAPKIKAVLKKYGLKGTLSVRHHSTLVLTIRKGTMDFEKFYVGERENIKDGFDLNPYWIDSSWTGEAKDAFEELVKAMKGEDYFDDSDLMTDYFHCSHYFDVKVGTWDKPYVLEEK